MDKRLYLLALMIAAGGALRTGEAVAQSPPVCMKGRPDAPVVLDVFSDYECPSCAAFFKDTMQSVFKDYADTGKVCVVYRDYPLKVHPHALDAARYARAAKSVSVPLWGKVAAALFESQAKWSKDGDIDGAVAAALEPAEIDRLREALPNNTLYDAIGDDIDEAREDAVSDAPSVVIIGRNTVEELDGALRYDALKPHLDAALAQ